MYSDISTVDSGTMKRHREREWIEARYKVL